MSNDTNGLEIERKFLVKTLPAGFFEYPHKIIEQGYLTDDSGDTEVRIRRKGSRLFLTVKKGKEPARQESEIDLSTEQFEVLWPLTEGRRVRKVRYEIPFEKYVIELDVYEGLLQPLVTAEVEFDTLEASEAFSPPAWMNTEVTGDPRFRNRNLSIYGSPQDFAV